MDLSEYISDTRGTVPFVTIVSLFMVLCTFFVFKFVKNMNLEIIFYKTE